MHTLRTTLRPLAVTLTALVATTAVLVGSTSPVAAAPVRAGGVVERTAAAPTSRLGADVPRTGDRRRYWGAISLSQDNAAVTISYRPTKRKAKRVVVKECKRISNLPQTCRWVIAFANQCAAVAVVTDANGYVTDYRARAARTRSKANRKAVRALGGGQVRAGTCTPV